MYFHLLLNHKLYNDESCNFLPVEDFIETYKIQKKPLKYFGLTSALRHFYKENFPKEPSVSVTPDSFLKSFLKSAKGNNLSLSKAIY